LPIFLTGGVAANKRLEQMIREISKEHNATFFAVPSKLAGDNGAMIAWTGLLRARNEKSLSINESLVKPNWRIDDITVTWDD
ncbi:MAG: hypothetical protein HWN66_12065, partial [Candidatus Helarchaeota archaeon]|nr:hypothetical protein [Candidatus Helarchaeota archaeon]